MVYKVLITEDAEKDLDHFIQYLLFVKNNPQAASNVLDDFQQTKKRLSQVAGSLKYCDNPRLKALEYKRINFLSHRYFLLFRIVDDTVIVDNMFHQLQDYENRFL